MQIKKVTNNIYEIPKEGNMKVPVIIYASENLLNEMKKDNCLQQMVNVAQLPGIEKSIVLPDAHLGYGFCIGGVAGFNIEEGIISPGGVGYDINCSVRLLRTNLTKEEVIGKEKQISNLLFNSIPTGVGRGTKIKITEKEFKEITRKGAKWAVEKGYGIKEDYIYCEENGCMEDANPEFVSKRAIERGINQLGSIGSGNHFLEIQYIERIFNEKVAYAFGIEKSKIVIMIHCGSRGFGHQIASDYIKLMEDKYGYTHLPDRQLICAPIKSELGKQYYKAMCCAANFAFCNKQILTYLTRKAMEKIFPDFKAEVVYDICHNIAKFEEHFIDGKKKVICVHRKGATRSFGKGKKELPEKYIEHGQPILIPGSMGTASYILHGTNEAEKLSFSSTAHGAGRLMSRHQAIKTLSKEKVEKSLEEKGVSVRTGSIKGLLEEAPQVYKDVDEVVRISDEVGIGKITAKLIPVAVIKG
ncbi:MAG: RtcB family protein [Candidatus Pacearchaeota archaeon]